MTKQEIVTAIARVITGQGNQAGLEGLDSILNALNGAENVIGYNGSALTDDQKKALVAAYENDALGQVLINVTGAKTPVIRATKATVGTTTTYTFYYVSAVADSAATISSLAVEVTAAAE